MTRSAASRAQRAAYAKAWRAAHPGYGTAWQASHRESERARARRWRLANPELVRDQKRRYAERHPRPLVDATPLPAPFQGHPVFDAARAIVGPDRNGGLLAFRDPIHDDLMSVAVVALLEGADATEAVRRYRSIETGWRRVTGPLFTEGLAA